MPILPLLFKWIWDNKQIIAEIIGGIAVAIICWWFFIHNPKIIKGLEADKAELSRQIATQAKTITLYEDIQKGRAPINAAVQNKISSMRSEARPKRTVIIRAGGVLPPLRPANATH